MSGTKRPRADVQKFADALTASMPAGEWHIGGSWRRSAQAIGDLDVLIVTGSGTLHGVDLPDCFQPSQRGATVARGDLVVGGDRIGCDIWACTPAQRGAFLMYITGPEALTVAQRAAAMKTTRKLNQYGLFAGDGTQLDDSTEEGIYQLLGMPWLEPAQRESQSRTAVRELYRAMAMTRAGR